MAVKISYNTLDEILSESETQTGIDWRFMDLDMRLDVLYEFNDWLKKYCVNNIKRSQLETIVGKIIEQVMDERDSEDECLYAAREFYNNFYRN